jgi:tetratricopeptide (TPR) repeat protein
MKTWMALSLALVLCTPAAAAESDPAGEVQRRLEIGERRYLDQDYRAAVEVLAAVLGDPVATNAERARAFEYIGLSWLILGKPKKAREAFEDLLSIDPHYTLTDPSRSPKLRQFFEQVREKFVPGYGGGPAGQAELEHDAPRGAVAGRPIEIAAVVQRSETPVAQVTLQARQRGLLTFSGRPLTPTDGAFRLRFTPPADPAGYVLEYYLEASDERGRVLGRIGSPERPIALEVRGAQAARDRLWYRRWWVWTLIGVGAGALVVGAAVGATQGRAPDGSLPPGRVSLGLSF